MKDIHTKYPHIPKELAEAFQRAYESAKNEAERSEIVSMLEEAEKQLAENEDAGEKIANELGALLRGSESRMQKIKRSHKEKKSEDEDKNNMSQILNDIDNNS